MRLIRKHLATATSDPLFQPLVNQNSLLNGYYMSRNLQDNAEASIVKSRLLYLNFKSKKNWQRIIEIYLQSVSTIEMPFSATKSSYKVHPMLGYWCEEKYSPFRYSNLVKSNTQLVSYSRGASSELGFHLRSQIMTVNNSLFAFSFYLPLYFLRATQSTPNVKVSWAGILWRQTETLLSNDLYLSLGRQDLKDVGELLLIACLK
jgi:hypothetical protein